MTIILFSLLFVCAVSLTKVSFPTSTGTTLETCPWVQDTDAEFDQYLAIGSIDILMYSRASVGFGVGVVTGAVISQITGIRLLSAIGTGALLGTVTGTALGALSPFEIIGVEPTLYPSLQPTTFLTQPPTVSPIYEQPFPSAVPITPVSATVPTNFPSPSPSLRSPSSQTPLITDHPIIQRTTLSPTVGLRASSHPEGYLPSSVPSQLPTNHLRVSPPGSPRY